MREAIAAVLIVIGATFMLLAAIGIVRMPDLFTRMQTATKGGSLGVVCTFLSVAVYFGEFAVTSRALLIIAFSFLTAPVAAHMIARAAYFVGYRLWEETVIDELRGHYDLRTHALDSGAYEVVGRKPKTELPDSGAASGGKGNAENDRFSQ